ncbi:LytTR family DNA-binding domain-containing protein [Catalinimonas sp. 4WD22]|uniref:LytR/AlgR family response regulator transcription factor n=1 Tax=Catalinimonas locisalis TaxID=3133978 RepID=UPI0031013431
MKKSKRFFLLIWGLILLLFLVFAGFFFWNQSSSASYISQGQFEKMLGEKVIKEVVLVRNENFAEITLKTEALNSGEYENILHNHTSFSRVNGPHCTLKILNSTFFDQRFNEAQKNIVANDRIDYRVEVRSGIGSFLLNWGILFWLLTAVPILLLWLVFKMFWSTKPENKPTQTVNKQNFNGSEPRVFNHSNFPVKIGDRTIFLDMNQIVSFQAKDNYVNVLDTEDNTYLVEYTLNELEEKLPRQFIRIHRSYIVNKLLIKEIRKHSGNRFTVHLKSKKSQQLVSSQSYAPKVKELMKF